MTRRRTDEAPILTVVSGIPETHLQAVIPERREPTPEEDREIRAQMAIVNELLGITPEDLAEPVTRLPNVNPEIRALITAKMGELAPR